MDNIELQKVLLTGAILGVTAALVVWFLERFEVNRLHAEVRSYLENYDQFQAWLGSRGGSGQQGDGTL